MMNYLILLVFVIGRLCTLVKSDVLRGESDAASKTRGVEYNDDLFGADLFGYRQHRDVKSKYYVVQRNSIPIAQAFYSTPQLSPSDLVYQVPFYEPTIIAITLRNLGHQMFNVTSIEGHLHAVHSFDFYVENYTERILTNAPLYPRSELSLEYRFQPWEGLALVDYVFSADVKYSLITDKGTQKYVEKVANITVMVYDSRQMFDFELLFMFILIVAFWTFVAWAVYAFYYIPTQQAKGKSPMTTNEIFEKVMRKLKSFINISDKGDMFSSAEKTDNNDISNKSKRQIEDEWLSGTALGARKRTKQKKN